MDLTPAMFHLLLALCGGELHGYALMGEVRELSRGRMVLGPGTLYRSLQRMTVAGLIEEAQGPVDLEWTDERRRYYRITEAGRQALGAEARRMAHLVELFLDRGLRPARSDIETGGQDGD